MKLENKEVMCSVRVLAQISLFIPSHSSLWSNGIHITWNSMRGPGIISYFQTIIWYKTHIHHRIPYFQVPGSLWGSVEQDYFSVLLNWRPGLRRSHHKTFSWSLVAKPNVCHPTLKICEGPVFFDDMRISDLTLNLYEISQKSLEQIDGYPWPH